MKGMLDMIDAIGYNKNVQFKGGKTEISDNGSKKGDVVYPKSVGDTFQINSQTDSKLSPADRKFVEGIANAMSGIALVAATGIVKNTVNALFPAGKKHNHLDAKKLEILENMAQKEPSLKKNAIHATMLEFEEIKRDVKDMNEDDAHRVYLAFIKSMTEDIKNNSMKYSDSLSELIDMQKNSTKLSKSDKIILKNELGTLLLNLLVASELDRPFK